LGGVAVEREGLMGSLQSKPNVLIVMSDQHHHRFMGCAGHEIMHTPAMDRLAASGLRFSNIYCPFPLCGPSRMSLKSIFILSSSLGWLCHPW